MVVGWFDVDEGRGRRSVSLALLVSFSTRRPGSEPKNTTHLSQQHTVRQNLPTTRRSNGSLNTGHSDHLPSQHSSGTLPHVRLRMMFLPLGNESSRKPQGQ